MNTLVNVGYKAEPHKILCVFYCLSLFSTYYYVFLCPYHISYMSLPLWALLSLVDKLSIAIIKFTIAIP